MTSSKALRWISKHETKIGAGLIAGILSFGIYNANSVRANRRYITLLELKKSEELTGLGKEHAPKQVLSKTKDPSIQQQRIIQKVPTATDFLVDHPVSAYLLENAAPILLAFSVLKLHKTFGRAKTSFGIFWRELVIGIFREEFMMFYYWVLVNKVYAHIPFFSEKRKLQKLSDVLLDYFSCNLPLIFLVAFFEALFITEARERQMVFRRASNSKFKPLLFLMKLIFVRLGTDFFFWLGHYIIHQRRFYWIHKKHHEHNNVQLTTNYHFKAVDLAIEGYLPFAVSITILLYINPRIFFPDLFEQTLLFGYIMGVEIASHSGKAIPTMTIIPPLSLLTRKYEDYNSWFHETHHNLLKCNYSVTPYWDFIFGTDRYP